MYDCVIIGAGISGASLAFELSKYQGSVLLLEKNNDVADETTKANSAIIHAGYDPENGTYMAKYNVEGNKLIPKICEDLDVHCKKIGSLVVAFEKEELATLHAIYERGLQNGVEGMRIVDQEELQEMEPNINPNAIAALYAPTACIVNPWELAIAYSELAIQNGVDLHLEEAVTAIQKQADYFLVTTEKGVYEAKTVVNAAGVACEKITSMVMEPEYHIQPNKGEYYLLDKTQGGLVHHVIFQCPTAKGKGILVAPTVHGNLIVGPTSENCGETNTATTLEGLSFVKEKALKSVPNINFRENIRTFCGIRARSSDYHDFVIGESKVSGFYQIAGMKSPGLSSSSAIAIDMVKAIQTKGLFTESNPNAKVTRKLVRFQEMSHAERAQWIEKHPQYGRIICRCETISEGEIIDALHRSPTVASLDAIKRRCTTGMGRCQGGFCGPRVQEIIARELNISQEDVLKDKKGSLVLLGQTKEIGD